MITTDGLILKEQSVGESDKLVTVLTRSNGILRCFCRRAKRLVSNIASSCQVMTYSRLTIYEGRDKYIIQEAEVIHSFFNAFDNINALALGYYMCETAVKMIPENLPSDDYLQLLLNCLYAISLANKPFAQIKAVFELRMMLINGIVPDILFCSECGAYEVPPNELMYYDFIKNKLYCSECCYKLRLFHTLPVSMGCVTAVRYCLSADPKKILSFQLSPTSVDSLEKLAERFFLTHCEFYCSTLDFYKSVKHIN